MLRVIKVKIAEIYVPAERRKELDPKKAEALAEAFMDEAEDMRPIHVRQDKDRYVLVKGVHRLEARKALGDETIDSYIVHAPQR